MAGRPQDYSARSRRWSGGLDTAGQTVGWAAWACAAWEPAKVSSVTLTAATTHTATAAVAIAAPGLARILAQLACLIACENLASQSIPHAGLPVGGKPPHPQRWR